MRMQYSALHTPYECLLSKKIENHVASLAIHYMHYNFGRIHQTLRITPAMAAGVTDHVWEFEEMLALIG